MYKMVNKRPDTLIISCGCIIIPKNTPHGTCTLRRSLTSESFPNNLNTILETFPSRHKETIQLAPVVTVTDPVRDGSFVFSRACEGFLFCH